MQMLSNSLLLFVASLILYTKYFDYKEKKEKLQSLNYKTYTVIKPTKLAMIYYILGIIFGAIGFGLGIYFRTFQTATVGVVLIAVSLSYILTFEVTMAVYVGTDSFLMDAEKIRYKSVRKIVAPTNAISRYTINLFNNKEYKVAKKQALAIAEAGKFKIEEKKK